MASATKRGNTYTIRSSLGYDVTGKQIQKYTTWKPEPGMTDKQVEKELERQKVLFDEKCRTGSCLNGSMKFQTFAEYWLTEHAEKQLRPTTINGYKDMLKKIYPAIGHIRLEKIRPNHLLEFYSNLGEGGIRENKKYVPSVDMRAYLEKINMKQVELIRKSGVCYDVISSVYKGKRINESSAIKISAALNVPLGSIFNSVDGNDKPLAQKTILHYHRLISSILEKAVKWQVIISNPCERVEAPKVERKEARYLDDVQAVKLLECLESEPLQYKTMVTLLLYSGMRRGELCGLEWSDVDYENCIIDINKSSLYLAELGVYEDTTKNFRFFVNLSG